MHWYLDIFHDIIQSLNCLTIYQNTICLRKIFENCWSNCLTLLIDQAQLKHYLLLLLKDLMKLIFFKRMLLEEFTLAIANWIPERLDFFICQFNISLLNDIVRATRGIVVGTPYNTNIEGDYTLNMLSVLVY